MTTADSEIEALRKMVAHFKEQDPNGPLFGVLRLCLEHIENERDEVERLRGRAQSLENVLRSAIGWVDCDLPNIMEELGATCAVELSPKWESDAIELLKEADAATPSADGTGGRGL